ncbi:MAG: hypothetical protein HKN84_02485, partial [Gammaproteobacteria bacterium]|nr:hypothetical protein [Gammaproteobacteria bacterium]
TRTLGLLLGACLLTTQLGACTATTGGSAPATTPPSGFFTAGQASRGERRFNQLCADCHRTVEITRSWFSGAVHSTAGDLFTVMSMTMPDSNPGGLSLDQYADILAFLLRLNNYPAGEEELPADPAMLANVPIPAP